MASTSEAALIAGYRRMHRATVFDPDQIRSLLRHMQRSGASLWGGMDHRNRLRTAKVERVSDDHVELATEHVDPQRDGRLNFTFEIEGVPYFLAASSCRAIDTNRIEIPFPRVIYRAERRSRPRIPASPNSKARVQLAGTAGERWAGWIADRSYEGLGIISDSGEPPPVGTSLTVHFLDGPEAGESRYGELRNQSTASSDGRLRLGLAISRVPPGAPVPTERRREIFPGTVPQRVWRRVAVAGAAARTVPEKFARRLWTSSPVPSPDVVYYKNNLGQSLAGIIDQTGPDAGRTAVLIPPAWGKTKETLLPLAETLVSMFKSAGESVLVLRYDGTQRRGESYIDPECRRVGDEALHFTYTQAVSDLHASVRYLKAEYSARRVVVVTFSLAAIEGRRAVATDPTDTICGWVSVVGMVDVQSGLRAVSGGVDYYYGALNGVRFGVHELGGVRIDIDHAAPDVLDNDLGCFEDAKRDMAKIDVPVTWIHGTHDGWIDFQRVQSLMSAGSTNRRQIIQVPTGHQLRNSMEALDVFQLVAQEVSGMLLGRRLKPALPDLARLDPRQAAERARLPKPNVDLRSFWREYLLGKDGTVGIQLLTATSDYMRFMDEQIQALELRSGQHVLDVGSGTGDFLLGLARDAHHSAGIRVTAVDFVPAAIKRMRDRLVTSGVEASDVRMDAVVADVDSCNGSSMPFAAAQFDAILASLLLSYLREPGRFLRQLFSLLKSGGCVVLSSPRRDADLSSLYTRTVAELSPDRVAALLGSRVAENFDVFQRRQLNAAARLVSLEESGQFCFRDPEEMRSLVREAGFRRVTARLALGDPPQVVIVTARKP